MNESMLTSNTRFLKNTGNKALRIMRLRRGPQERRRLQKSERRESVSEIVIVLCFDTMLFCSVKKEASSAGGQ